MVDVVAEDEGGAWDWDVRKEGEGNAVLIFCVGWRGEVRGCNGGVAGET